MKNQDINESFHFHEKVSHCSFKKAERGGQNEYLMMYRIYNKQTNAKSSKLANRCFLKL